MGMAHATDCKSFYELENERGTVPSERRLLLESEALRHDIEAGHIVFEWASTKQALADFLTKDQHTGDYRRFVLKFGRYPSRPPDHDRTSRCKSRRQAPTASSPCASCRARGIEDITFFEDVVAEVRFDPLSLA